MSSVIRCCYFLVSLLCLSLLACNARPLAGIDKKPAGNKIHSISNQQDDHHQEASVIEPKVEAPSPNEYGVAKDSDAGAGQLENAQIELKDAKAKQKLMADDEEVENSGAAPKESLVSVSWRVPQKKRGERHPGFNLDYSPPKIHPPSHN